MPKFTLPEGAKLPAGVKLENLAPDPGGRFGHYHDISTDTVYGLGFSLDEAEEAPAKPAEELVGVAVKFADGKRGKITEAGGPDDGFFARVLVDGEEREVKDKADIKRLTKAEIAAWDKEIAEAGK